MRQALKLHSFEHGRSFAFLWKKTWMSLWFGLSVSGCAEYDLSTLSELLLKGAVRSQSASREGTGMGYRLGRKGDRL